MEENYYWSDDYSPEFYIEAAKSGFITTSMYFEDRFILLPEIQYEYAILDFDEIKIPRKVKKILKDDNFKFYINKNFDKVVNKIRNYHKDSWINNEYATILNNIRNYSKPIKDFELISAEIYDKNDNFLVSGEIGYRIGTTYTSLTGFTTKSKKYNNWGKLQLVLLNDFLKNNGYSLWNLGHPQLQYKIDLGAKVYTRESFLKRFLLYKK
ncbi:MAG: hypothetical protein ACNI25_05170 [Halarcobacter sp.]